MFSDEAEDVFCRVLPQTETPFAEAEQELDPFLHSGQLIKVNLLFVLFSFLLKKLCLCQRRITLRHLLNALFR